MNHESFGQEKRKSDSPQKTRGARPLREFTDEPKDTGRSPIKDRANAAFYWLLPLVIFLLMVVAGSYFALTSGGGEEVGSAAERGATVPISSDQLEIPDLMSAYLEATGGRAAIQEIRSVRYDGRVKFNSGESDFQMLLLKPDKGLLVTNPREATSLKLIRNGDYAWQVLEGQDGVRTVSPLDEHGSESLKWSLRVDNTFRLMALEGPYTDLSVRDVNHNGQPCYEFTKAMPDGTDFKAILEKETLYLLKTEDTLIIKGEKSEFTVVYDDHRMVSGVVEPFKTTLYRNGEMNNEVIINSIRMNAGVISSLFEVPEEIR